MSESKPHAFYATLIAAIVLLAGLVSAQFSWTTFSPMKQTLSSLAARDAPTRNMMTVVILIIGACQLVTAHGFKTAANPGRMVLGLGGFGVIGVAAFPVPHILADSNWHTFMAGVVLVSLCLWPVFSISKHHQAPWMLTVQGAWTATVVLAIVGLIFLAAWWTDSYWMGLLERILIFSQIIWLLFSVGRCLKIGNKAVLQDFAIDEKDFQIATKIAL